MKGAAMTTEMKIDLFNLVEGALRALGTCYEEELRQANANLGFEGHDWGLLFSVQGLEPQPTTAALLQRFAPYFTPETLESQLAEAAGRGFLTGDAARGYGLTERGRDAITQSF